MAPEAAAKLIQINGGGFVSAFAIPGKSEGSA
jgi:hypothetical protein